MNWRSLPLIAFDTETTGFYPETGDRMIEFAAVEFTLRADGSVESSREHQFLINPERPIPRDATEVSGIGDDHVAKAPLFAAVADAIHAVLSRGITVAHNFAFDQRFLSSELARCGKRWPHPVAEIDTLDLSRRLYNEAREHNLAAVSARLGVVLTGAHRATNDARACGEAFLEMARRHDAPTSLAEMIVWADGIGDAPGTGHLLRGEGGVTRFATGRFAGQPVEEHPDELAWMTIARERSDAGWQATFPAEVRDWAERYLRVRASGRNQQGAKGFGPNDWGIDPPVGTP